MVEDGSNAHAGGEDAGENAYDSLSDAEQAIVRALRAPASINTAAFGARVMAAVRREPRFGRAQRPQYRSVATISTGIAAVAAMVVLMVMGSKELSRGAHAGKTARSANPAAGRLRDAASVVKHPVRFTLVASGASRVVIAGSFNGWNTAATPLRRISKDTWSIDVPLGAGRYEYQFVIDGRKWVADPRAAHGVGDDFGATNSVVTVPITGSA